MGNRREICINENFHNRLDALLAAVHEQVGVAVYDRITGQGGPPELLSPDLSLDRLLSRAHRATKIATVTRLGSEQRVADRDSEVRSNVPEPASETIISRPPGVRLKYRRESLVVLRKFWPRDLVQPLQSVINDLRKLLDPKSSDISLKLVHQFFEHFAQRLAEVRRLPEPRRRPVAPIGTDYLEAIENFLAEPSDLLFQIIRGIDVLVDEEIVPIVKQGLAESSQMMVQMIIEDLDDDLGQACGQAVSLSRAASEVEQASNHFVGADLHSLNLEGVPLAGVRWDARTTWPAEWDELIRRSSVPARGMSGVLVVLKEPYGSTIQVDA